MASPVNMYRVQLITREHIDDFQDVPPALRLAAADMFYDGYMRYLRLRIHDQYFHGMWMRLRDLGYDIRKLESSYATRPTL